MIYSTQCFHSRDIASIQPSEKCLAIPSCHDSNSFSLILDNLTQQKKFRAELLLHDDSATEHHISTIECGGLTGCYGCQWFVKANE